MKLLNILSLLFLFSCAQYVDSFHRQIDREETGNRPSNNVGRSQEKRPSDIDRYRNRWNTTKDKRPINSPLTYSLGRPSGRVESAPKRDYQPQRYKASDFRDEDDSGSLWANQGSSASLFTHTNDKRVGDIVIVNVLEDLRNQISNELKSSFPKKKAPNSANRNANTPAPNQNANSNSNNNNNDPDMDFKIYDKISGTIIEELNKDYMLLRGRKEIIYQKEKRSIEVQALVSKKDILENDYVNSDRLLESRVVVLRDR